MNLGDVHTITDLEKMNLAGTRPLGKLPTALITRINLKRWHFNLAALFSLIIMAKPSLIPKGAESSTKFPESDLRFPLYLSFETFQKKKITKQRPLLCNYTTV